MKRILPFFFFLFFLTFCSKSNEPNDDEGELTFEVPIQTDSLFSSHGTSSKIVISTNAPWSIEAVENTRALSWLSFYPSDGKAGVHEIDVKLEPNNTIDERSATAIFNINGQPVQKIVINQAASNTVLTDSVLYVNMLKDGNLKTQIKESGINENAVKQLIVVGEMNADDIQYVNLFLTPLRDIDFSGAVFDNSALMFKYCKRLQTIKLPECCTALQPLAFYSCISLTDISAPEVKSAGTEAFAGCVSLVNCNLPKAETLGSSLFLSCSALKILNFPCVKTITSETFRGCKSVEEACFDSLVSIPAYAFSASYYTPNLSTISFPKVTSIGNGAFNGCSKLTKAFFPSATELGINVFYGTGVKTVKFPSMVVIPENAFQNIPSLRHARFEKAVTIGNNAFKGCKRLCEANFPKATTAGSSAFRGCLMWSLLDFSSLETVGDYCFADCVALNIFNGLADEILDACGESFITEVIGDVVTIQFLRLKHIGSYAFSGCWFLQRFDAPLVTDLESGAFSGSTILSEITTNNVLSISSYVFNECTYMVALDFPNATSIHSWLPAFGGAMLKSLKFGKSSLLRFQNDSFPADFNTEICDLSIDAADYYSKRVDLERRIWCSQKWRTINIYEP